jgi:hypothetical protein
VTVRTRRILLGLVLAMWLFMAWSGISGGMNQISQADTVTKRAQTVMQFAFGVFAVLTMATMFRVRSFAPFARAGWIITVTLAAGLAPVVWGGTGWATGVVAGMVGLGIAALLLWFLRLTTRP